MYLKALRRKTTAVTDEFDISPHNFQVILNALRSCGIDGVPETFENEDQFDREFASGWADVLKENKGLLIQAQVVINDDDGNKDDDAWENAVEDWIPGDDMLEYIVKAGTLSKFYDGDHNDLELSNDLSDTNSGWLDDVIKFLDNCGGFRVVW